MNTKILRDLREAYSEVYYNNFEFWVESLISEGYDLSDYTWEEMYEAYIEEQQKTPPSTDLGYRASRGITGALRDLVPALGGQLTGKNNPALQRQRARGEKLKRFITTGKIDTGNKSTAKSASRGASAQRPLVDRSGRNVFDGTQVSKPQVSNIPPKEGTGRGGPSDINKGKTSPQTEPTQRPSGSSGGSGSSGPATRSSGASASPSPSSRKPEPKSTQSGQTGDKAKDMDTWAKANPKLAAAAAERDRTRGTSATTNPLMRDFKSRLPAPSPAPDSTKPSPQEGPKPNSNGTYAPGSAREMAMRASARTHTSTPGENLPPGGKKAVAQTKTESLMWGSSSKMVDEIERMYSSIYEGKKVDQDSDGDNDFADVRIARLIASGMSKEEAISKVKNKSYNEEFELDEAAKRTPRKIRGSKDSKAYMAGRSDAGKRISGDDEQGPRYYTLGRARGATLDRPTKPGERPINTPKVTKSELDYARYRYNSVSGKSWNRVGGSKGLPGSKNENFELWLENLLDEGYDLSDYTLEEMYEIYEEYVPWDFGPKQKAKAKYTQLAARKANEKQSGIPGGRGTATRANKIFNVAKDMRTTLDKDSYKTGADPKKQGLQPSTQRHTAAALRGAGGGMTASKMYNVKPLQPTRKSGRSPGGSSSLSGVGSVSGTGRYTPGGGGRYGLAGTGLADDFEMWISDLLDEGYDLSDYTLEEMYEIYEESEEEKRKNERRARIAELQAQGRVMTPARRERERLQKKKEQERQEKLERLANSVLSSHRTSRSSTPMGSNGSPEKESAPSANRKLKSSMKNDTLASRADELIKMLQSENFQFWVQDLLNEGFTLEGWTNEELVELYEEIIL